MSRQPSQKASSGLRFIDINLSLHLSVLPSAEPNEGRLCVVRQVRVGERSGKADLGTQTQRKAG